MQMSPGGALKCCCLTAGAERSRGADAFEERELEQNHRSGGTAPEHCTDVSGAAPSGALDRISSYTSRFSIGLLLHFAIQPSIRDAVQPQGQSGKKEAAD
ncbi:hypothetical protein FQA47_014973 [Oryzias melastigma]|uniref:Uncharacterized protein n=1 Tax=Oryzias melastigma TaxID=30732 RepID=A0A834F277_ORYME|nr:hypothetical protein FQA47_014973 [Oryzias melastigma]